MDFFNKLGDTLSGAGKEISSKTKELSETVKINTEITKAKSKIEDNYRLLGKTFYEKYKDNAENEYAEFCKVITDTYAEVEKLELDLLKIKGIQTCPVCKRTVPIDDAFCSYCGSKLEKNVEKESENNCEAEEDDGVIVGEVTETPNNDETVEAEKVEESEVVEENEKTEEVEADDNKETVEEVKDAEAAVIVENENKEKEKLNERVCSVCENKIEKETDTFCANCGAKIDASQNETNEKVEEKVEKESICKNCGMKLDADDLFCTNCGTKVE